MEPEKKEVMEKYNENEFYDFINRFYKIYGEDVFGEKECTQRDINILNGCDNDFRRNYRTELRGWKDKDNGDYYQIIFSEDIKKFLIFQVYYKIKL